MISEYTREAGVRTLERQIGTITRKVAAKVAHRRGRTPHDRRREATSRTTSVRRASAAKRRSGRQRPGVATGLAWTEAGGDVLFIEAVLMPGGDRH